MWKRFLPLLVLLLAAAALHLPAHLGTREPLPEDGPALVRNPALDPAADEGFGRALSRVIDEPSATWANLGDTVGRTRWRPLTAAVRAVERRVLPSDHLARGAALLALLLHVVFAAQTLSLAVAIGVSRRAATAAALLVVASPAAVPLVDWPARQAAVLAAPLALLGLRVASGGGAARAFLGGLAIALAGLAHEAAFALVLAVPLVRAARVNGTARPLAAWPAVLAPAAALVAVVLHITGAGGIGLQLVKAARAKAGHDGESTAFLALHAQAAIKHAFGYGLAAFDL